MRVVKGWRAGGDGWGVVKDARLSFLVFLVLGVFLVVVFVVVVVVVVVLHHHPDDHHQHNLPGMTLCPPISPLCLP